MIPDIGMLMEHEAGTLSEEDTVALFQDLIDSGMAWKLQGHYGRTAMFLIQEGLCTPAGESVNA